MADGDIDALEKLRDKHHNSDTRGDCLDDFITYHIAPVLKIRPSYEDCLRENAVENELIQIEEMSLRDDEEGEKAIQIDAMLIQPSTYIRKQLRNRYLTRTPRAFPTFTSDEGITTR